MNLLNKKWIKYKNKDIEIKRINGKMIISNKSKKHGFIVTPHFIDIKEKNVKITFEGKVIEGLSGTLNILDTKKKLLGDFSLNSSGMMDWTNKKNGIIAIKILADTTIEINKIEIEFSQERDSIYKDDLKNDILVITPSYPSPENKYLSGFVHSRLVAYKKSGINFDLICAHNYQGICKYEFEGIKVLKMNFTELRKILQKRKYKSILVHFFDNLYANVFDACDLSETNLFFWVHGPETLYWDWVKFTTPYFAKERELTTNEIDLFMKNNELIKRYNNMPNVKWIFVSNWIKRQSEELINIKFNNSVVIPNIIDEETFSYRKKDPEQRKKIFFIRRFDNCNKYAIDVNIRTILELSRRDCFKNLEFNIYGTGDFYEPLIQPIKQFRNVHFYPKFFTHEEIAAIHKENGIGLFATRYDAQGVSMCEAAASGLAIVASDNDAIKEFLPRDDYCLETENYIKYADAIEKLYNDPQEFEKYSEECYKSIIEKCNFSMTVGKEIELIKNIKPQKLNSKIKANNPVLSVIIPAYNVSEYLEHCVNTLLNHNNADKMEILIVNDGSKDNTLEIANKLAEKYNIEKQSVIKIIDKENGGHGSTINIGIEKAQGRYIRIVDGDDWVNSKNLEKLVNILEKENSDIVITNYSEDIAYNNQLIFKDIYNNLTPNLQYKFDDLCYYGYGFIEWGPILATGNFKASILKNSKYKLSEKCFYVDMEFDLISIIKATTLTYYDLDIYRYFIGRPNQSVSAQSFAKNVKQHEKVLFNIIDIMENDKEINDAKKYYAKEKILVPMIKAHYIIVCDYLKSSKEFRTFDKKLQRHGKLYNDPSITTKYIKFQRQTKGLFLKFNEIIKKTYRKLKRR